MSNAEIFVWGLFFIVVSVILFRTIAGAMGFTFSSTKPTDPPPDKVGVVRKTKNVVQEKIKSSWAKKDLESKRWTLYTTTAAIAIIILYLPIKDETLRYTIAAWFILLMLHLVIWPFYTEKTSLMTKIVISSIIVIIGIAAVSPNEAIKIKNGGFSIGKKVITSTANGVSSLDDNYGKTSPVESVETPTAKTPEGKTEVVQYDAYTGGWTEIPIPQNVKFDIRCPEGNVMLMVTSTEHPQGSNPWDCLKGSDLGNQNNVKYFAQATEGVHPVIVKTDPWWQ